MDALDFAPLTARRVRRHEPKQRVVHPHATEDRRDRHDRQRQEVDAGAVRSVQPSDEHIQCEADPGPGNSDDQSRRRASNNLAGVVIQIREKWQFHAGVTTDGE